MKLAVEDRPFVSLSSRRILNVWSVTLFWFQVVSVLGCLPQPQACRNSVFELFIPVKSGWHWPPRSEVAVGVGLVDKKVLCSLIYLVDLISFANQGRSHTCLRSLCCENQRMGLPKQHLQTQRGRIKLTTRVGLCWARVEPVGYQLQSHRCVVWFSTTACCRGNGRELRDFYLNHLFCDSSVKSRLPCRCVMM